MTAPVLYFGTRNAKMLKVGTTYTDDGVVYNLLGRSERVAPAGAGGECIFTALYVTTRHFDTTVQVKVTPIVDNVALTAQTITLTGASTTTGNRQTHELVLSVPYSVGGVEQIRTAPRGTWIELLVETPYSGTPGAKQIVEDVEVEYDVVRETQSGEAR